MTDSSDQSRGNKTNHKVTVLVRVGDDWQAATLLKWQYDLSGRWWAAVAWSDSRGRDRVRRFPEQDVWTAD